MSALKGARVLILEDEAILAFALEDMLLDLGCDVVGPALRLSDAIRLIEAETIDAAVLDVNISGERSYAIAEKLDERAVPYVFATGYGSSGVELKVAGSRVLTKPYRRPQIEAELRSLLIRRAARLSGPAGPQ